MAKKRENEMNEDVSKDSSSSPHKKHKHKKHKKHKRKRSHASAESPDYAFTTSFSSETVSSDSTGKPSLKLKIKFGGQTFGTKNVDRLTIPESTSEEEEEEEEREEEHVEDEEDTFTWQDETPPASLNQSVASSEKDEEEAWLDALEAGELDDYGEIKKEKDLSTLTARQRALLHGTTEEERQLTQLPNINSRATAELSLEMLEKKAQRAQKRRVQAKKKVEENKKQTIERLLKKQDFKIKGNKTKNKKQLNIPCVSYVNSLTGISLSYPPGRMLPMAKSKAQPPKPRITCGVSGCTNPKLYSCSKTGVPLCSLACYKKNLSTASTVPCVS